MTNEELRRLCEQVADDTWLDEPFGQVRSDMAKDHYALCRVHGTTLARSCLQLLNQCEAMREMLYDVAEIAKFLSWRSDIGCDKAQEIIDSVHEGKWGGREGIWVQVSKAISHLGGSHDK